VLAIPPHRARHARWGPRIAAIGVCLLPVTGHGARPQDLARGEASQQLDAPVVATVVTARLAATTHPPLPARPSQYWLVPERPAARATGARGADDTPLSRFARGVAFFNEGNYAAALTALSSPDLAFTPVDAYARYYSGFAQLRLERFADARDTFDALRDRKPIGYLAEAIELRRAELATAKNDAAAALRVLEPLSREKTTAPEDVLMRLARAADASGDTTRALAAYRRVYYEFPLSAESELAGAEIARLEPPSLLTPERFKLNLGRAERLFGSRKYPEARDAFASLARIARGDDKELVSLRIAECDYYLKRFRASRDALVPYLDDAARKAEARFFHLTATRAMGDVDAYLGLARRLVDDFPEESWAEEALNNLASHHIVQSEDAEADRVLRELYRRFPQGPHAVRAAWEIGWWSYKNGDLDDAIRVFEEAAAAMPRADWRPAWLYWAGRAHDRLGRTATATARYRLVVADYLNSYYGRLAARMLERRREEMPAPTVQAAISADTENRLPPTEPIIRQLVGLGLYDEASRELQYAQRVWGDSPAIQATYAWIYHEQGDLRRGINAMKRAYPQYLASGGEVLPAELLRVLFPVDYWPLIKKHAEARDLDPYLVAALIAQESTFTADIKSVANAVGLMQLLPSTGRRYARSLGMRFTASTLTDPESNVRLGTTYFKELVDRFGGAHFALASYNAGENRIARWITERPGFQQDEFIDDIPYPETQNYVKRILGTADDYRRLYGGGLLVPGGRNQNTAPAAAGSSATPKPAAARKPAPRKPAPRKSASRSAKHRHNR
jgi:soluble lytic murein transglycosylase